MLGLMLPLQIVKPFVDGRFRENMLGLDENRLCCRIGAIGQSVFSPWHGGGSLVGLNSEFTPTKLQEFHALIVYCDETNLTFFAALSQK